MDEEQIDLAIENFKLIAALHKKDLQSIGTFPYWSNCSLYLNKLKSKCAKQDISQDLQIFESFFAELEEELPRLIAAENLDEAKKLYQSIKNVLFFDVASKRMSC